MALFGRPTPEDEAKAQAYGQWLRRRNPLALVAFVLGIFSLTHLGSLIVDAGAAVGLGCVALRQLRSGSSAQRLGRRLAWSGIITGAISLMLAGILYSHR